MKKDYFCKRCNHKIDRFGLSCEQEFTGWKKWFVKIPILGLLITCSCLCLSPEKIEKN